MPDGFLELSMQRVRHLLTRLGTVVDPRSTEVLQQVRAPYERSALLMSRPGLSRVNPGDNGCTISRADTGEWVGAPGPTALIG